jgi:hypothetical protein
MSSMNLTDMLIYADIAKLHQLATNYRCACNIHSKHELIQSILSEIMKRDVIENQLANLDEDSLRFLHQLMFEKRVVFSAEELIAIAQSSIEQRQDHLAQCPQEMIRTFKEWGWMFHGHKQQDKSLYYIPTDLKKRWMDILKNKLQSTIVAVEQPQTYTEQTHLLRRDIELFLEYVQERSTLTLKANYSIGRRDLTQILSRMNVKELCNGKRSWRFGYGRMFHEYPNRFSFIYDYCCQNQYLAEQDQMLQITEQGIQRLAIVTDDHPRQLYACWLKLYRLPIPNLHLLVNWIGHFAQSWVTLTSLKQTLCPLIRPYFYDSADTILEERILQMLYYLGFICIGINREHVRLLQFSKLGTDCLQEMSLAK